MKCEICGITLVKRVGKFGDFLACPSSRPGDNHGTVSIHNENNEHSSWIVETDRFEHAIKSDVHSMGIPFDHLTSLAEFLDDDPKSVPIADEWGEPIDHWSNDRPW